MLGGDGRRGLAFIGCQELETSFMDKVRSHQSVQWGLKKLPHLPRSLQGDIIFPVSRVERVDHEQCASPACAERGCGVHCLLDMRPRNWKFAWTHPNWRKPLDPRGTYGSAHRDGPMTSGTECNHFWESADSEMPNQQKETNHQEKWTHGTDRVCSLKAER